MAACKSPAKGEKAPEKRVTADLWARGEKANARGAVRKKLEDREALLGARGTCRREEKQKLLVGGLGGGGV